MKSTIMENAEDLSRFIGQRIAQRRAALALTMDDIATRAGVSRAMISRIERGEVHASAVVLDRLCAGLDMTLQALFARDAVSPLLRHADQPVWRDPSSHYLRREVAPAGAGLPIRITEIEFPPGADVAFEPVNRRGLNQFVWLLAGALEVTVGGAVYHLAAGDCFAMVVDAGNRFHNPGTVTARYAVILASEFSA